MESASSSVMKILIFTDTHLGFKDTDEVLGQDSIETFEEILKIAKDNKVDCILHSGDLFDENRPSRATEYQTLNLMSEYLLGNQRKPLIKIPHVSEHADLAQNRINFLDENVKVEIPMFMIHGNHDDPGGIARLSAMDILSSVNLINYFGRKSSCEDITIGPIIIEKHGVKLALYGLGNIRDERLHRTFEEGRVKWIRAPGDEEGRKSSYYNVLLFHQNRFRGNQGGRPNKHCILESMLPSWLDLVIWGHEHECLPTPIQSKDGGFLTLQLGSSVATSYISCEAVEKRIVYMELKKCPDRGMGTDKTMEAKFTPVPLRSVRPFKITDLTMKDTGISATDSKRIWDYISEQAERLIQIAREEDAEKKKKDPNRKTKLPLIRLKVDHTEFPCNVIGGARFGQQFLGRVANVDGMLLWHKRKKMKQKWQRIPKVDENGNPVVDELGNTVYLDDPGVDDDFERDNDLPTDVKKEREEQKSMDEILFDLMPKVELSILPQADFNNSVLQFVEKGDIGAIERFVKTTIKAANSQVGSVLDQISTDQNDMAIAIRQRRDLIRADARKALEEERKYLAQNGGMFEKRVDESEDDFDMPAESLIQQQATASGKKPKAKAKGKAKAKAEGAPKRKPTKKQLAAMEAAAAAATSNSFLDMSAPSQGTIQMGHSMGVQQNAMGMQQSATGSMHPNMGMNMQNMGMQNNQDSQNFGNAIHQTPVSSPMDSNGSGSNSSANNAKRQRVDNNVGNNLMPNQNIGNVNANQNNIGNADQSMVNAARNQNQGAGNQNQAVGNQNLNPFGRTQFGQSQIGGPVSQMFSQPQSQLSSAMFANPAKPGSQNSKAGARRLPF